MPAASTASPLLVSRPSEYVRFARTRLLTRAALIRAATVRERSAQRTELRSRDTSSRSRSLTVGRFNQHASAQRRREALSRLVGGCSSAFFVQGNSLKSWWAL